LHFGSKNNIYHLLKTLVKDDGISEVSTNISDRDNFPYVLPVIADHCDR
jgi:hypothetical protein